jgi:hypothetical protein
MTRNFDNRKRAFADVVTIEAWHDRFSERKSRVDLHADVVFGTARVGGEQESPVRFRLSVKRAEVVVIVPETEPVSVDKKSVSRDSPEFEGHMTETIERKMKASRKAKISASVSPKKLHGSLGAEAGGETGLTSSKKLSVPATVRLMLVTQSQTDDGQYRWLVEPSTKPSLDGRPWDSIKRPRLRLIDKRKDRNKGIPPSVRVEVRCRREDLLIEDLMVKDETVWQALKAKAGFRNRMAAAESYIRDRLSEEGLEVKDISDIFCQVTLASTTADAI